MQKIIITTVALLMLSACNATQKGAAGGAIVGGGIGAVVTGSPRGAVLGAAAGGLAGALLGRASEEGKCRYRDRRGRVYIDDC
ncbi:MAG: glycine zipper 2TM domain-containing protein [Rhizobiaceae bacterium]